MHADEDDDDDDHDHRTQQHLQKVRVVQKHSDEEKSVESCFEPKDYVLIYEVGTNETTILSYDNVTSMFPAIIQQQLSESCINHNYTTLKDIKPSDAERYGYGTLAIVIISILPFFFIAIIPSAKRQNYRYIMACLMALSASTMIGDAFLHLLPQALAIHGHGGSNIEEFGVEVHEYVLKQVVVIAALYAFYL